MPDNNWMPRVEWGASEPQKITYDFSGLKTTNNRPYDADSLNYIGSKLSEHGYDDLHIAAILGTIAEESGGDPYAVSDDGSFQGLMQWAGDRYSINPFMIEDRQREMDRQLEYIINTIDNTADQKSWTHGGEGSGYKRAVDAHDAWVNGTELGPLVHALNRGYVRPTGKDNSVKNRLNVSQQIYDVIDRAKRMPEPVLQVQRDRAEATDNTYAGGGGIHIKPENRGKFTALKKRTGHSATWFKEHGTPAQKKMAIFDLNSKHWSHKHADGGELDEYYDTITPVVKTAYAPDIKTKQGRIAAQNMADAVASGQYGLQSVPRSYQNYVQGELYGARPVRNAINRTGEMISPFVGSLAFGPLGGIAYLAGEGVNTGINTATNGNKNSWGDIFVDEKKHPILNAIVDATNPAYSIIGTLEAPQLTRNIIGNNRNFQKALRLYDYGQNPRTLTKESANLINEYLYPARNAATQKKSFTKAERAALSSKIMDSEQQSVKRIFGERYDDVFRKHATTPYLKKVFKENPEYLYFIEQTGYDPMAQSTIDAFAKRQMSSVRGIHLDNANDLNIRNAIEQYKITGNPGGDRFGTNGGVYSSNSQGLADIFQRGHNTNVDVDNVIAKIQYPYSKTNGNIRTQLKNIRNDVVAIDDWRNATDLLFSSPDLKAYKFIEGPYAKRTGEIFDVYERATTKPMKIQSYEAKIEHGLPDMMGRWGRSEVSYVPGDEKLFIPKVTTRGDISKIISGGKNQFNRDIYDTFMKNVYEQNTRRNELIESSFPYKVGKHVYDHTNIIGGKEVYMPLVGVGIGTGAVGGSAIGLKAFHDKKKEMIENEQRFMASPYYRKYLEEREGLDKSQMMDLRNVYFEQFMKDSK